MPDQLKISDGWVRCGYCSDVFDATLNLQPWEATGAVSKEAATESGSLPTAGGNPAQHTRTRVFASSLPATGSPVRGERADRSESRVAPPAMVNAMNQASAGAGDRRARSEGSAAVTGRSEPSVSTNAGEAFAMPSTPAPGQSPIIGSQPEVPTPVAQFLAVADESDAGVSDSMESLQGSQPAEIDALEQQRKEMSHQASDEWGDADFMAELRRYAAESKAEKTQVSSPAEPDPEAAAPEGPPQRAVPVPLPPLPSKVRPTPRRSARDYANERHAADALSEGHDSESPVSSGGFDRSTWDSESSPDSRSDAMEGRPSVLRVDLTVDESSRKSEVRTRSKRSGSNIEAAEEVPMAEDDVSSRLMEEGVELSFVQQARRRAFWHSAGVRWTMGLLSVGLAGLLIVQWMIQSRNELVAARPELRPVLQAMCNVAGCDLGPAHQIEQLSIDFNELRRRLDNLYTLEFGVRNASNIPLAVPAVELSLPKARAGSGQPIARRVFLPQEWPGQPTIINPGERLQVNLSLTVASDIDLIAAGEYKLYLFYP